MISQKVISCNKMTELYMCFSAHVRIIEKGKTISQIFLVYVIFSLNIIGDAILLE